MNFQFILPPSSNSVLSSVTKNDCTAMEFASIDCPTYEIAMKVLKTARLRARAHGSKYR